MKGRGNKKIFLNFEIPRFFRIFLFSGIIEEAVRTRWTSFPTSNFSKKKNSTKRNSISYNND